MCPSGAHQTQGAPRPVRGCGRWARLPSALPPSRHADALAPLDLDRGSLRGRSGPVVGTGKPPRLWGPPGAARAGSQRKRSQVGPLPGEVSRVPRRNRRRAARRRLRVSELERQLRHVTGVPGRRGERTKERPVSRGPHRQVEEVPASGSWGHAGGSSRVAGAPEAAVHGRALWRLVGWLWGGDSPSSDGR